MRSVSEKYANSSKNIGGTDLYSTETNTMPIDIRLLNSRYHKQSEKYSAECTGLKSQENLIENPSQEWGPMGIKILRTVLFHLTNHMVNIS